MHDRIASLPARPTADSSTPPARGATATARMARRPRAARGPKAPGSTGAAAGRRRRALLGWVLALTLPFVPAGCSPGAETEVTVEEGESLVFETLGIGFYGSLADTTEAVYRTRAEWDEIASKLSPIEPFPDVDTSQVMVVLAAIPARTGGYHVRFESVHKVGDEIVASYVVQRPGRDCISTNALTVPFAAISVRRSEGTMRFERRTEVMPCST